MKKLIVLAAAAIAIQAAPVAALERPVMTQSPMVLVELQASMKADPCPAGLFISTTSGQLRRSHCKERRNRTGSPWERSWTPWYTEGRKPLPHTLLPALGADWPETSTT